MTTIKVLIADDDPPTRMLLRAAIAKWGYTFVEASDGEEAWQHLSQDNPPRLLIIDWLMPKIDGLSLCIRSRKELTFQPYIILLTQVTGPTNLIKGLEAGADEFLSKPFNVAELRSRLSIGARLISNENKLMEKSKQLEMLNHDIQSLLNTTKKLIKDLTTSLEKEAIKNPVIQQQIQDIDSNINALLKVI